MNKSIIEAESPQLPQYYYSGKFSSRRRIRSLIHSSRRRHHHYTEKTYDIVTVSPDDKKIIMNKDDGSRANTKPLSKGKNKKNSIVGLNSSNDATVVEAAQSAVDHWESVYFGLRSFLIESSRNVLGVYNATKNASHKIEHSLLVPIRDAVILPAFQNGERLVSDSIGFLQSDQAKEISQQSLEIVKQTPIVGPVASSLIIHTAFILHQSWKIALYPIPTPQQVRHTVNSTIYGTKWLCRKMLCEIYFFLGEVDATITRISSHTQWNLLGQGPYQSLSQKHKKEVLDHLCERYLSLETNDIARYELIAHIRHNNQQLYHDLVESGLLLSRLPTGDGDGNGNIIRNGASPKKDVWLHLNPDYRQMEQDSLIENNYHHGVSSLWFYLPTLSTTTTNTTTIANNNKTESSITPPSTTSTTNKRNWVAFNQLDCKNLESFYLQKLFPSSPQMKNNHFPTSYSTEKQHQYKTHAQWYEPNPNTDILVDQKRYAVSFLPNNKCSKNKSKNLVKHNQHKNSFTIQMRPTMWRFHNTSQVRRGIWLMHTQRFGLQPYDEKSSRILEDAYLFLKYSRNLVSDEKEEGSSSSEGEEKSENVLLTVQVLGPDQREEQLVQFRSLQSVTAIPKTLGAGFSLFKRRVYRGVSSSSSLDESLDRFHHHHLAAPHSLLVKNNNNNKKNEIKKSSTHNDDIESSSPSSSSTDDNLKNDTDTADHLILVVHGIGEMLRTTDLFGLSLPALTSTIIDCCDTLRKNHDEVLSVHHSQKTETTRNSNEKNNMECNIGEKTEQQGPTTVPGRVEYLPIEWHEAFAIQSKKWNSSSSSPPTTPPPRSSSKQFYNNSKRRKRRDNTSETRAATTIEDISLQTIPYLREFANDTMLDVLYFMSPNHHDIMIDIVVKELNFVVQKYRKLNPDFQGQISILSHSLGSVIMWDILSSQPLSQQPTESNNVTEEEQQQQQTSSFLIDFDPNDSTSTTPSSYPQLNFEVMNNFMIGSPVAVFLSLRSFNNSPYHHQQQEVQHLDKKLPGCLRVYNIFHPYDPVAYRIEPMLDRRNAQVEPKLITHYFEKGSSPKIGFRVQYETKMLLSYLADETRKTQNNLVRAMKAGMDGVMNNIGYDLDSVIENVDDENNGFIDDEDHAGYASDDLSCSSSFSSSSATNIAMVGKYNSVYTGNLCEGKRIDYMLQEKEIENANEYLFALAAHSSYWGEKDLSLFIARQIYQTSSPSLTEGEIERDTLEQQHQCLQTFI